MNARLESPGAVRMKWIACFLPVVAVALLMVRAELRKAEAVVYEVPITGYDPRDPIHGQYIRFRYAWPEAKASCTGSKCCLCFRGPPRSVPEVRRVSCEEARSCDAWAPAKKLEGRQRYLVPEHAGRPLEAALRDHPASVELECSPDGGTALGELYLSGRPWREMVEE